MIRRLAHEFCLRVRAGLCAARFLRPGCAQSACSGRGVFSVISDVLGVLALFAMLFVLASFGA
ncbi:hypothetical protein RTM1035_05215 [Roseovarius sp. TM1035]|jgi:hypothetical protein|uniref:hypothetical protein n=1 Tax=Roseovarius sp. TM1035 TaxID=391613 RepID=UPI0001556C10|nr:hypothetical protein [Roseovarius sp. TM1035]AWZ21109.1 Hypothetical protein RAK1035_2401 [Roseovarius sp. AK1035]EDM32990.1 hypothetical protein RTM1035_05215 [Roseovarius sp. TM1035]